MPHTSQASRRRRAEKTDGPERPATRRRFLKSAALGLGGAALAASGPAALGASVGARPGARQEALPPEEKLGIALVGLGSYATGQLAPALQETERCRLAGIVTGTPAKAERWQKEHGIPEASTYNYETFDRIADDDAIDIVYVVLPNGMHAEYTVRAAEAGKHVICEKPMATSVAECERMIAACEAAGRKLSIGYRLQFEPHHLEAMRLGQEEAYGPVRVMENAFGFHLGGPPTRWRLDRELAGGGALMDVGIYALQAARYTTGEEPVSVFAQEQKTEPERFAEVDETVLWQMEFPGGAVANCSTSYNARFNRLYAAADQGWFEVAPAYGYGGIEGRTSDGPMGLPSVNQQARQMDAFAECIMENEESRVSGEEGLRDMRVIEAIYQSIEEDRKIQLG